MIINLDGFVSSLGKVLGVKMIGLLQIGSNINHDNTAFSDVDFILLGNDFGPGDWQLLRDIVRHIDFLVDMPVILKNQLPENPDLFQMGTYGCYFINVLKGAKIIYGINFFKEYSKSTDAALRASLFRKLAEYSWTARRVFVESNRERTLYQNYQMNSRLLKAVKDLLWLSDINQPTHSMPAKEAVDRLRHVFGSLFFDGEWRLFESLSDLQSRDKFVSDMSEEFLQERLLIFEKIYDVAFSVLNASH